MKSLTKNTHNSFKIKRIQKWKFLKPLKQVARLDHSISVPSFGTLFRYEPDSPLGKAQDNAAAIFGTPFAYPSTNGTTPLNVIALLTLAYPGDTILIQRDSHVSLLAPMIHAGLRPVFITPRYSYKLGVTLGITGEELIRELDHHPETRVVFLTYPNYFGIATDISDLARITMERGIPLAVDSAHGSHWAFHSGFPIRAEQVGAKIVTYSTHKTCLALGQGSIALFNDTTLIPRLYEVVNNLGFVSTSFSSIILTGLFNGIYVLSEYGETILSERLEMAEWARQEINKIEGLHSFGLEEAQPGFIKFDPLRLTVDVSGIGLTGYEIEDLLIKQYGFYPEMGTLQNVLFLITPGIEWKVIKKMVKLLHKIAYSSHPLRQPLNLRSPDLPRQALTPRDAFYCRKRKIIPTQESVGTISGETISAYPPGSAVIVAGEVISQYVVDYLKKIKEYGGVLKGASDYSFNSIQILDV